MSEERIVCFEPVAAPDARLLILGSMPSVESLKQSFYYAHPRNAFWPIMADVLGEAQPANVEEKKSLLVRHQIALWDVANSCMREGSLDSAIRDAQPNDFGMLFARCPKIEKILFNGASAQKMYMKMVGDMPEGCTWAQMPSTSPAYTLKFEMKRDLWRQGMEWIL